MIILGIDPGTATTGYGVIKVPDDIIGREFEYGIELMLTAAQNCIPFSDYTSNLPCA